MSNELKTDLVIWAVAVVVAIAFGAMAVPADAQDTPNLILDNSVKIAPPARPSVQTIVEPGEHLDVEKNHTRHSHNEKRLQRQLEEQRNARSTNRGGNREDNDRTE